MLLSHVNIVNFRSIARAKITFDSPCIGLVGINESGKSNILKALSLLRPTEAIAPDDVREPLPSEPVVSEACVDFVFHPTPAELASLSTELTHSILGLGKDFPLVSIDGINYTLREFVKTQCDVYYWVNLLDGTRSYCLGAFGTDKVGLLGSWFKPTSKCPSTLVIEANGKSKRLRDYALVGPDTVRDHAEEFFEPASQDDLHDALEDLATEALKKSLPRCIYWKYTDSHLLPGKIPLAAFVADPATCIPLRNMFSLAGIPDPAKHIAEAQKRPNGLRNSLDRVAKNSTTAFRSIWKEYAHVSFDLSHNGEHIEATIRDTHNVYDMARRSDGFKRFVAFLLTVSSRVRTSALTNSLLLCDEPDISLHPSGIRYLRDELIGISKTNYVVFSSHSIHMIDTECVSRHIIVTKKQEQTSVARVSESNITDEEVIYNAMGYSLFEALRPFNIIFEGWLDKKLFRTALQRRDWKSLAKDLAGVGTCHAKGTKDISHVEAFLELANRRGLIVSDADAPAKEKQKEYKGDCPWKRYDQLSSDCVAETSEDFLASSWVIEVTRQWARSHAQLSDVPEAKLRAGSGRIAALKQWIGASVTDKDQAKDLLESLKHAMFHDLQPNQIDSTYESVLQGIRDAVVNHTEPPVIESKSAVLATQRA